MTDTRRTYAIFAITKHGLAIAERLRAALANVQASAQVDLYVSERLIQQAPAGSRAMPLPMGPTLRDTFKAYECHIHIISVGAVVRMVAPLMDSKKVDPAIVCVDDAARFAVCVLSGHVGRGNEHTQRVAEALGAHAVITTASDVGGTLTVDILGRELGWQLDDPDRNVTSGCAAVVNQAQVALVQETGEPNFWPLSKPLPPGVRYFTGLSEVNPLDYEMLLIVSDRDVQRSHPAHCAHAVIYRPKSLVLGVGCDSRTPAELIERGIRAQLGDAGLDLRAVRAVATLDKKRDEPGLLDVCERFGWKLHDYDAETLDAVPGIETPSEVVKRHVGTRSVAEAACLKLAGAATLVLPKRAYTEPEAGRNMTLAVARIPFAKREEARSE